MHECSPQSDHHKPITADKDITIMLEQLRNADVFNDQLGRNHHVFAKFKNNPTLSKEDVNVWMKSQWTKLLAGLL